MATTYLTPGVYVEEVDKGSKPIEGVGTAMAAFIGFAERGPVNEPTFLSNWTQFVQTFGSFIPGGFLAHAVYGFFNNGGTMCYVTRLPLGDADTDGAAAGRDGAAARRQLPSGSASLPAAAGGGAMSLDITAADTGSAGSDISVEVLPAVAPEGQTARDDEFTIQVKRGDTVERFENVTFRKERRARNVVDVVNAESKLVRVAERESTASPLEKMPVAGTYPLALAPEAAMPATTSKIGTDVLIGDAAERTGLNGLEVAEDATMIIFPDLMALFQAGRIDMEGVQAVQQAMLDHAQLMHDRVAILDSPPGMSPQRIRDWRMKEVNYDSKFAALYYPWIKVANPLGNGSSIMVPPSGHMAGIWARNDAQRGVHKAPANEVVAGAIGLEYQTTAGEQAILNPVGVNVIRSFPGRGIRVWLDGALFGDTAAQAYYVKVDEENNPVETRDVGQLIIEVGIAPVKPAEFVIIRVSQWQSGGEASE